MKTIGTLDTHLQGERLRRLLERHGYAVSSVEIAAGNIQASVALPLGARHSVVQVGDIQLDADLELVAIGGVLVQLTATESSILHALMLRYGRFVSTAELIATMWPGENPAVCKGRLYTHVCTLRRKLSEGREGITIASSRHGYRMWVAGLASVDLAEAF
jgi:DNA-binding response OmpR family regulator